MIGRGIFNNPWVFEKNIPANVHSKEERLKMLLVHLDLFQKERSENLHFQALKKYFKIYLNGFAGAVRLRKIFMETNDAKEASDVLAREINSCNT
jgi:tRNA-dihydrouridine synthase